MGSSPLHSFFCDREGGRGVGGTESVRLRAISQPKPLGLGAEMPMEQDEAQCSGLGLSGAQDTVISGTGKSKKTLCSVYLSLAFSRIIGMTPDTSGKHPRKSAKDLSSQSLSDQTARALDTTPPLFEIVASFFHYH